jgi:hypothetical protein
LAASGGKAELLVAPEPEKGELSYSQPVFLPGGGTVLFTIAPRDPKASYKVAALDLESRERTTIVTGGAAPRYSPTGHLLYVAGGRLHAVAFDADTLTTRGDPQIVVDGEVMRGNFDLSDNGTLVYQRASKGTGAAEILVWVGRDGRQEPLPDAPSGWSFPVISPDGKRVTAERWPAEGRDIYVWDLERRSMSRVTDNPAEEIRPHWSADGSRIFFASNRTGPFNIYSRAADGTGSDELVFASDVWTVGAGLTPDGAQLFAHKLEPSVDIIAIDLEPPHDARYLLATSADESSPSVSPDGRWVAYASDHEGHSEIYVGPFPDMGARRWKISTSGGGLPFWSPKGDEIFFRGPTGSMMSAQVTLEPTFAPGKVTELFPNPSPEKYGVGAGTRDYDVSLDGRFLMKRRVSPAASPTEGESPRGERLVVVLDWFDELKAKVPVR